MTDMKERILLTALGLFARDGYEAVSVSDIAGALGITKGALYRHYKNKRDVFDSIMARMEQRDAQQARAYDLPEGTLNEMTAAYQAATPDQITAFSQAMFRYWTQDPFASSFRRMITLEQFRSEEMGRIYQQYLGAGPLGYLRDLFAGMGAPEPEETAVSFYAPMFLLFTVYDGAEDQAAVLSLADRLLKDAGDRLKQTVCGRP